MSTDEIRIFSDAELELIAKTLSFFKNTEIAHFLEAINVTDSSAGSSKWIRIYNALAEDQNNQKKGNKVLSFIRVSLDPKRFINQPEVFTELCEQINSVLHFQGLQYHDDGKFHTIKKALTLSDSQKRASLLKEKIIERHLDQHLLVYCKEEFLTDNYFHAVFEATKGISKIIRQKTGLSGDGAELCDKAFTGSEPLIKINKYHTKTEISEQTGFNNLLKGVYGVFRNPLAHELKNEWIVSEQDALDLFSTLSYIYRRIESN